MLVAWRVYNLISGHVLNQAIWITKTDPSESYKLSQHGILILWGQPVAPPSLRTSITLNGSKIRRISSTLTGRCDIDHWWTGATSCRTSDSRHRIKTWKPGNLQPEIHWTSGSLVACRLSSPLKWDMESWHAERDPEVQWISAQQKIADIDCSRRWKPWLRWSLPFPTRNVLNAPRETSPRTGSRSSVECSHRRLPRWSSSQLEGAAEDLGKALAMLAHNSIADVAYAGFLRPFVSVWRLLLEEDLCGWFGLWKWCSRSFGRTVAEAGLGEYTVDVSSTDVTDKGLSALGKALKVGECSLKEVNADKIGTDTGVTALLMGLAQCPDLEEHPFITPLCKRKPSKWPWRMWRNVMCGRSWNNWKWNMGTKATTSSLKIRWQPPIRVMLSQENRVFAFECVIQSETMFPDYSPLLG